MKLDFDALIQRIRDLEAEQALLGCLLVRPELIQDVTVAEDAFASPAHQLVYRALHALGVRADPVTVMAQLRDWGKAQDLSPTLLVNAIAMPASVENWRYYEARIRTLWQWRRFAECWWHIAGGIGDGDRSPDEYAEYARAQLRRLELATTDATFSDELRTVLEQYGDPQQALRTIPFGLPRIDDAIAGQQPGELIVLAAAPGMGKSTLATHLCEQAAKVGPCLLASNEMRRRDYTIRMLVRRTMIPQRRFRGQRLDDRDYEELVTAAGELATWPITLSENCRTIDQFRTAMARVRADHGTLVWAALDWIQMLKHDARLRRTEQLDMAMAELKELAIEYAIPIVVVAQLAKAEWNQEATLASLRDSGMIGAAADIAIFIESFPPREAPHHRDYLARRLVMHKARQGGTDEATQDVWFDGAHARFYPMTPAEASV